MKEIEINLKKLADEVLEQCSVGIDEDSFEITDFLDYYDIIENHIFDKTPDAKMIKEPALATLIEELKPWILKAMMKKINKQFLRLEPEDFEILKNEKKRYELEDD